MVYDITRRSTYNHLSSWLTDARNLTNPNTVRFSSFSVLRFRYIEIPYCCCLLFFVNYFIPCRFYQFIARFLDILESDLCCRLYFWLEIKAIWKVSAMSLTKKRNNLLMKTDYFFSKRAQKRRFLESSLFCLGLSWEWLKLQFYRLLLFSSLSSSNQIKLFCVH